MKFVSLAVLATFAVSASAQSLFSNQSSDVNVAQLEAVATSRNGTSAPAGGRWSEVQANGAGPQLESNTVAGFTASPSGTAGNFRLADDFTVTGPGWNVTGFKVYGYQTGSALTANPITGGSLNIWNGRPGDSGASIIGSATFGGTSNTIAWAGGGSGVVYRIFNSDSPAPGSTPGTTRVVREVSFNFVGTLAAGTYWIDYQLVPATGSVFNPGTTHLNSRGVSGANGRQLQVDATTNTTFWADLVDTGNPAAAADVNQELPFMVTGTAVPEPATLAILGLGAAALLRRRRK